MRFTQANKEVGTVQNLDGKFYVKDEDGNVVELKNGDVIEEGMTIIGDKGNLASARVQIMNHDSGEPMIVSGSQEQSFDASFIEGFSKESNGIFESAKDRFEEIKDHLDAESRDTSSQPKIVEHNFEKPIEVEVRPSSTPSIAIDDYYQATENGSEYDIKEDIVDTIENVNDGENVSGNLFSNDFISSEKEIIEEPAPVVRRHYENKVVVDSDLEGKDKIQTKSDNDEVVVKGDTEDRSKISTGSGDDKVVVEGDVEDRSKISTGSGDDEVIVKGDVEDSSKISTGSGDDKVVIVDDLEDSSILRTGSGKDEVIIQDLENRAKIDLGSDDDKLTIKDKVETKDGFVNGGSGDDKLVLEGKTQEDWESGIKDKFINFEKVTFSDGKTINLVNSDSDDMSITSITVNRVKYDVNEDNTEITLPHGTITISPNGDFNYVVDNTNDDVQELNVGDSLNEVFSYTLSDGIHNSTASVTIAIDGRDDAPVVESIQVNENSEVSSLIFNDIDISDVDDADLEGASVALVNYQDGDSIIVGDLPAGITVNIVGASVELSGSASVADYESALKSLSFETTSLDSSSREFVFSVFDGDKHSEVQTVSLELPEVIIVNTPVIENIIDTSGDVDLSINGTANVGNTITLYYGDEVLGTTDVDENGHWSFVDSERVLISDIEDSSAQHFMITATATDINGNVSEISNVKSLIVDSSDTVSESINGTDGNDIIFGGNEDTKYIVEDPNNTDCELDGVTELTVGDDINAGAGDDVVYAGAGDDVISGGAGADTIDGGTGNDRISGGAGADTLDGADDFDILTYKDSEEAVKVNLLTNEFTGGDAEGDVISNFERIDGSSHDDVLIGNNDSFNYLLGGDGNDTIEASGGNNFLHGGSGSDTITGGSGRDNIVGGSGADKLDGGDNFDALIYADSNEAVNINLETNEVSGGFAEGDVIQNFEAVRGSAHNDTLVGNSQDNYLRGDAGDDTLVGGAGDDTLVGGAGDDTLIGGAGDDTLAGQCGADIMDGGEGFDTLKYDNSLEAVSVNLATSELSGGFAEGDTISNIESVRGSAFDDIITGDSENNYLIGNAGADIIDGGAGNDRISGGTGADTLDGSSGFDVLTYEDSSEAVKVNLLTNEFTGGDAEGDVISNFERIDGSDFDDVLIGNNDSFNYLLGGDGNDTIEASGGNNFLHGGSGNDTITGADGVDTIVGGSGADKLDGGDNTDYVIYADSNEAVNVNLETNEVSGGFAEGDVIQNFEGVRGSAHDDVLIGSTEDNYLRGDAGNDTFTGSAGDDTIDGGTGDDVAIYSSNFEDYIIESQNDGSTKVKDTRENESDGEDILSDVETLQFVDGSYDVESGVFTSSTVDDNEEENLHFRNVEYHSDTQNSTDYDDYIEAELTTSEANDTIIVEDDIGDENDYIAGHGGARTIDTGAGDDVLAVGGDIQHGATVNTGAGDDKIIVGDSDYLDLNLDNKGSIEANASVNTGTGNDYLSADLLSDSSVDMGDGNDTLALKRVAGDSNIETGTGDDKVTLNDVSSGFDDGSVNLGSGDDKLTIDDTLAGTDAIFDGGDGEDTLVLNNVTREEWDNGVKDNFVNFEHVVLNNLGENDDTETNQISLDVNLSDDTTNVENTTQSESTYRARPDMLEDIEDVTNTLAQSTDTTHEFDNMNRALYTEQNDDVDVIEVDGNSSTIMTYGGDDIINIDGNQNRAIDAGNGNNRIDIDGNSSSIYVQDGNDSIRVAGNQNRGIDLNDGDNQIDVAGNASNIYSGSGSDVINIGGNANRNIGTEAGDDYVTIGGNSSKVDLGAGNDIIEIGGNVNRYVEGGEGVDTIILNNYSKADWDSNVGNIQNNVMNFENIKFNDGEIIGDSSAFSANNSTTTFYTTLSIVATQTVSSEAMNNVEIEIPNDVSVNDADGNELTVTNGVVSLPVISGTETSITLISEERLTQDELDSIQDSAVIPGSENIDNDDVFDLADGMDFDFSDDNLENLHDISEIDMQNDSANSIEGITLDDILEMTDDNNTLTITGDDNDALDISTDGWTQNGPTITDSDNGMTTYEYSNSSGDIITLNIDEQINSTGM